MSIKTTDPFAVEVGNNECVAMISKLEAEGKVIHRMEAVEHGYVLRFYTPVAAVRNNSSDLVNLLLDFSADV